MKRMIKVIIIDAIASGLLFTSLLFARPSNASVYGQGTCSASPSTVISSQPVTITASGLSGNNSVYVIAPDSSIVVDTDFNSNSFGATYNFTQIGNYGVTFERRFNNRQYRIECQTGFNVK